MNQTDRFLASDNEIVTELIDTIGLEHTQKLVNTFGGSQLYIPMIENIAKEYRNSEIYRDYKNGMNYHALSQKYNLSSVTIRKVVKCEMERRKAVSK